MPPRSRFSEAERLVRKRRAARLRQQRCRARKRLAKMVAKGVESKHLIPPNGDETLSSDADGNGGVTGLVSSKAPPATSSSTASTSSPFEPPTAMSSALRSEPRSKDNKTAKSTKAAAATLENNAKDTISTSTNTSTARTSIVSSDASSSTLAESVLKENKAPNFVAEEGDREPQDSPRTVYWMEPQKQQPMASTGASQQQQPPALTTTTDNSVPRSRSWSHEGTGARRYEIHHPHPPVLMVHSQHRYSEPHLRHAPSQYLMARAGDHLQTQQRTLPELQHAHSSGGEYSTTRASTGGTLPSTLEYNGGIDRFGVSRGHGHGYYHPSAPSHSSHHHHQHHHQQQQQLYRVSNTTSSIHRTQYEHGGTVLPPHHQQQHSVHLHHHTTGATTTVAPSQSHHYRPYVRQEQPPQSFQAQPPPQEYREDHRWQQHSSTSAPSDSEHMDKSSTADQAVRDPPVQDQQEKAAIDAILALRGSPRQEPTKASPNLTKPVPHRAFRPVVPSPGRRYGARFEPYPTLQKQALQQQSQSQHFGVPAGTMVVPSDLGAAQRKPGFYLSMRFH